MYIAKLKQWSMHVAQVWRFMNIMMNASFITRTLSLISSSKSNALSYASSHVLLLVLFCSCLVWVVYALYSLACVRRYYYYHLCAPTIENTRGLCVFCCCCYLSGRRFCNRQSHIAHQFMRSLLLFDLQFLPMYSFHSFAFIHITQEQRTRDLLAMHAVGHLEFLI